MYNQIGTQDSNSAPARIPPPTKLLQARNTRITRIVPLQIISIVVMQRIYNEITKANMGIIPQRVEGSEWCKNTFAAMRSL